MTSADDDFFSLGQAALTYLEAALNTYLCMQCVCCGVRAHAASLINNAPMQFMHAHMCPFICVRLAEAVTSFTDEVPPKSWWMEEIQTALAAGSATSSLPLDDTGMIVFCGAFASSYGLCCSHWEMTRSRSTLLKRCSRRPFGMVWLRWLRVGNVAKRTLLTGVLQTRRHGCPVSRSRRCPATYQTCQGSSTGMPRLPRTAVMGLPNFCSAAAASSWSVGIATI